MRAVELIRDWLQTQEKEIQDDIAATISAFLDKNLMEDVFHQDNPSDCLIKWLLNKEDNKFRALGKAISFVNIFDYAFTDRFTSDGWIIPQKVFEKVIEERPSESMVQTANKMLSDMPRRQELWRNVGNSWNNFKEKLIFEDPI